MTVSKQLLAREAEVTKRARDLLDRHFPDLVKKPVIVYFKAMPGMNLQGIHYYNGRKNYLILNQDFADSPLLDLLLAHELGHVIDETKQYRWQERLFHFLKRHNICNGLHQDYPKKQEICSDWFCLLTGLQFLKEWSADEYALFLLKGENIGLETYRALIDYPRKYKETSLSFALNEIARLTAIVHLKLRTRC